MRGVDVEDKRNRKREEGEEEVRLVLDFVLVLAAVVDVAEKTYQVDSIIQRKTAIETLFASMKKKVGGANERVIDWPDVVIPNSIDVDYEYESIPLVQSQSHFLLLNSSDGGAVYSHQFVLDPIPWSPGR
jgi:hypothetical protein